MVALFEEKHRGKSDPFLDTMREVYADTEKLIVGKTQHTPLTVEAYCRTMESLRGGVPLH